MGIRLKVAQTAKELDDVFWVRRRVYVAQEGKFGGKHNTGRYLTDRFDAHPNCANLIAYEGEEPVATIRLNLDDGVGLPPEQLFDFARERRRIEDAWRRQTGEPAKIGSAGMLAVRRGWRRRRDVIRALFKLAGNVGKSWNATHILVAANHENANMYQRVGFSPLAEKIWNAEIGNYVVPLVSTFADFYARTVGPRLDGVDLLRCFSSHFQRVVFRTGERIFSEYDEADECYVIDVGSVKITTSETRDGRELSFAVLGSGEIFGEMALIDAKTRSANAIAVTDTEVIALRRADFMEGLKQHPDRLDLVLNFISDRLRRMDEFAKLLAYGSPGQRLEFALKGFLDSAKATRRADGSCVLKAGPLDLAAAAGTDESEAAAFLDELTAQGLCEYNDKVIRFLLPNHDSHQPEDHARSS
jgi:CRP-like cAMP-binding protein